MLSYASEVPVEGPTAQDELEDVTVTVVFTIASVKAEAQLSDVTVTVDENQ